MQLCAGEGAAIRDLVSRSMQLPLPAAQYCIFWPISIFVDKWATTDNIDDWWLSFENGHWSGWLIYDSGFARFVFRTKVFLVKVYKVYQVYQSILGESIPSIPKCTKLYLMKVYQVYQSVPTISKYTKVCLVKVYHSIPGIPNYTWWKCKKYTKVYLIKRWWSYLDNSSIISTGQNITKNNIVTI